MRTIALALLLAGTAGTAVVRDGPMAPARAAAIDEAVRGGMARTGAKGLALAVVEDARVVLIRA